MKQWVIVEIIEFQSVILLILICSLVKEGIALAENGLSPYAGDIFHEVNYVYYTSLVCLK